MITNYSVNGMTCEHCVHAVTEEVSAIAGVDEVKVSLDDKAMAVTSAAAIDFDAIKAAVEEAGEYVVAQA